MSSDSKLHYINISNPKECPVFDYIISGDKMVEGRKNSPTYHDLKIGDFIVFQCNESNESNERSQKVKIIGLRKYETLENYIDTEGFNNVLPNIGNRSNAIRLYNSWTSEEDRECLRLLYGYGFLAIELKIVEKIFSNI